jgi:hypothetical protein
LNPRTLLASDQRTVALAGEDVRVFAVEHAAALLEALEPDETAVAAYHVGASLVTCAVLTSQAIWVVGGVSRPKLTRIPLHGALSGTRGALMRSVSIHRPGGRLRLWGSRLDHDQEILASVATPASPDAKMDGWLRRHPKTATAVGVVAALAVIGSLSEQQPQDPERAAAAPALTAPTPTPTGRTPETDPIPEMPHLIGDRLDLAQSRLAHSESIGDVERWDLSPRDRSVWADENWTVALTEPAAGEPLHPGTTVYLFYLRTNEWRWFDRHPTMPGFHRRTPTDRLVGERGLFAPVSELIEFRYPKGRAPRGSWRADRPDDEGPPLEPDPSKEPNSEWRPRQRLTEASNYGTLAVGSLPRRRQQLRTGQLLTLLVVEKPTPPASGDDGVYLDYDGGGDGDDDWNVPGWLCPTRFC